MLGHVPLVALLATLAWFVSGCGGNEVPDAGPAGEVRVVVRSTGDGAVEVGVEGHSATLASYERTLPESNRVAVEDAAGDWWHSSEIAVEALGVVTIGAGTDGFGLQGATRHVVEIECRYLRIEYGGATALRFSSPTGYNCDTWEDLGEVMLSDSQAMLMRVGLRAEGNCVILQLDLRQRESGRGDWRTLPAGMICDLDLDRAGTWRASSLLAIPYYSQGGLLEARPLGSGVSAAVDGQMLQNDCGWVTLLHGRRSVWQMVQAPGECAADGYRLDWVLWVAEPGEPDDPLDRQQLQVYDWEWEVDTNLLPNEWFEPITGLHAERIVRAVYEDFFGNSATPPDVRRAPPDAEYAGSYDADSHTIFLAPQAMNVALVLHETAHALLRLSAELDEATRYYLAPRHGPAFVARLIMIWTRYSEGLDMEAIQAAAELHGVTIGEDLLTGPRGGEAERQAVIDAIRGE